ncbi:hypothetical protein [Limosilactobacillus fermentum]|uniref:hypothetical protein n=1 Tax=Limosilactobacillus fermentum TaxID=1613 RepID=UPI003BB04F02
MVVNAFSTSPAEADNHQKLAEHLVHRLGGDQRLLVILGAGSLLDGADDHLVVDDIKKAPGADAWIAIPEGQKKELDYLRTVSGIDWVGISPSYTFKPGPATTTCLETTPGNPIPPPARWPRQWSYRSSTRPTTANASRLLTAN